jgi:hypothetical protein
MSETPATYERSARIIAASVAGSLGLLLVAWLALPAREAPETAPDPEPAAAQAVGVQPTAYDPARRVDGLADEPPQLAAAPAIAPAIDRDAERERYLEDPPPPVLPDPAAIAATQARDQAVPLVTAQLQDALDDRRSAIRRACWKGGAPSASVFMQATVDARGQVIAQTFGDDGKVPGLADCMRAQALPNKLSAPGVEVTVRAGLTFE